MPYVNNGQIDAQVLASMGYEQQLSRGFRNWAMSASFCAVAMGTVPFTGLDMMLQYGGPATALGSWFVISFFSIVSAFALAEIASAYPNAGAMYHWAGQLVPPRWAPLTSYVTGMLLVVGNISNMAVTALNLSQWVVLIVASQTGIALSTGAAVGIAIATVSSWTLLNLQRVTTLAWCYVAFAVIHLCIAVVLGVSMYSLTPPPDSPTASALLSDWINQSGFSSGAYVAMIGASNVIYSLSGYEVRQRRGDGSAASRVIDASNHYSPRPFSAG